MKSFKAWLLVDITDTYAPSLHLSRRDAKEEAAHHNYLRDAKWRVVRVSIRAVSRSKS